MVLTLHDWGLHDGGIDADAKTARRPFVVMCYAAVLIFSGFLLLYGLNGRLLWGDEAETAVLARNVTRFGVLRTEDGTNNITL